MGQARPFVSHTHLIGVAEDIWWHLGDGDWLEAFTHHPQIGADIEELRARFAATATWSEGEQAGMSDADDEALTALAEGNRAYLERYGHIFIVCASGKSAVQMDALLRSRMNNESAYELRIAAGEQMKITRLRLEKLGSDA
jgi:2-oxo-4-hydroxy-4-carboxy-5-ureidoimidazoline decarboxylase